MNLIRYYNQNRKKIWGILIIIASAFLLLQMVNYFYKINHEKAIAVKNITTEEKPNKETTLMTNQSVVTGKNIDSKYLQDSTTTIDSFISYCNHKELEKAYNLLTDECKTQMYETVEMFEKAYYNNVFKGESKNCTIENWIGNTFKIKVTEDILSTGKTNKGYSKQDYITVKKVDDEYKLNINNYIGYMPINKQTNQNDISIQVVSKNTYMEHEEYTIKVTNETENTILLDRRLDAKTLALQDSKGVLYSFYSHELTEPMLTVLAGQTKEITIKFYSTYVSTKDIKYIVFSDVSLYNEQGRIDKKIELKANV